jgi:purine catabolism regulator
VPIKLINPSRLEYYQSSRRIDVKPIKPTKHERSDSMGLTVQEALEIASLKKAKVVGGHQGLNNIIRFVNVMEVPEVIKWLRGEEFLVTTGFSIKDDATIRCRLIDDLAQKKVAALGIKPGPYLENVPEDMIDHADRIGLPLIELDPEIPYIEIIVPIFEILLNNQLYCLKRNEQIHNRLLEVLLSGNGFSSICQVLVEIVNNPVLITDRAGTLLSFAMPPLAKYHLKSDWENKLQDGLYNSSTNLCSLNPHHWHRIKLMVDDFTHDVVVVPIKANGDINGNLVIIESCSQLDEIGLIAVERASTIIALQFVKEKAVLETEYQIRGEILEDIIGGNFKSEKEIIRRASYLSFNLNTSLVVFVIAIDHSHSNLGSQGRRDEKTIQKIKSNILQVVHSAFRDYPGGAMLLGKSESINGLVHQASDDEASVLHRKLTEIANKIVMKFPKIKFSIGLGSVFNGVRNTKQSFEEATAAARIGRIMRGPFNVTLFEDLGPYRFLYKLKDTKAMTNYYSECLGRIIGYDQEHNTELLTTLNCYFKNDCSLSQTAKRLYIHKNSVIYRLKKIEELSGLSVNNSDECFNLHLCLKFGQLMGDFR